MQTPKRSQHDREQELYSELTALTFEGSTDTARQEFKAEADINNILKRFGVGGVPVKIPQFGTEVDYDLDLQQAYMSIAEAKQGWAALPDNLKKQYPTWQQLLTALDKNELTIKLEEPPTTTETT